VKWSVVEVAEKPPKVLIVTSTVPAGLAGDVAVIEVSELTVKLVAATSPKKTPVAPVNPVPVTMTDVPPARVPEFGLTPVTVGAEAAVNV
jgi:hypothetical protein